MVSVVVVLQPGELESLRRLAAGPAKRRIPSEHVEKLVGCGYAAVRAGAPTVTIRGHAKLAFEVTRSSWFATPV